MDKQDSGVPAVGSTMDFRHIDAFRAVMLTRTTTRAAQLLGMSQPGISRLIGECERATGLTLFSRERGRLEPTPQASLLFNEVQRRYAGLENIREFAQSLREGEQMTLRVGCVLSFALRFSADAIARFRSVQSNVNLEFSTGSVELIRDRVAAGTLALGIVTDTADVRGTQHTPFATLDTLCALPAGHPLAAQEVVTAEQFRRYPVISYPPSNMILWGMDHVFAGLAPPQLAAVVQSSVNVADLVRANVGIGLVHPVVAYDFLDTGLVFRRFAPTHTFRTLKILPKDADYSPHIDAFSKALDDTLVDVMAAVEAATRR